MTTRTAIEYQDTKQFYKRNKHFATRAVPDLRSANVCLSTGPRWPGGLIFVSKNYIVASSLLRTQCTCLT
jgi:hypothetical protein